MAGDARYQLSPVQCPVCPGFLQAVPMEVSDAYIRYELRCYGPHTDDQRKRAVAALFDRVPPEGR